MNTLSYRTPRAYLFGALLAIGNLLLPQLCHLTPLGGPALLPIYFFTLIAAYRYGMAAGLTTALLSPLLSHLLFAMPSSAMLPVILAKGTLLAAAAAWMAQRARGVSVWAIIAAVVLYQSLGMLAEWAISGSWTVALQAVRVGYPGMLLQVFGGYAVLKALSRD